MSQRIVDVLEAIQVKEQDGDLALVASRQGDRLGEAVPDFEAREWTLRLSPKVKKTETAVLVFLHEVAHMSLGLDAFKAGHERAFEVAALRLGLSRDGYSLGFEGERFLQLCRSKLGRYR